MNDEFFDRKLADALRDVAIPSELHARLLELPRQPAESFFELPMPSRPELRPANRSVSGRRFYWGGAAVVAAIAASLWLGWSLIGKPRTSEPITQRLVEEAASETDTVGTSANQIAELQRMRTELQKLELAYQELEQDELTFISAGDVAGPMVASTPADAESGRAEAIFWTAETSLFSGLKTDAVREQLKYLVEKFPDSNSAKRAAVLLADF